MQSSQSISIFLSQRHSFIVYIFFFFNDTATTEIYTLSLHDALPIWRYRFALQTVGHLFCHLFGHFCTRYSGLAITSSTADRKSTRLNSSHSQISYAVFCLKKKKKTK